MANGGKIEYTIGFNVDKSGLNQLQAQLQKDKDEMIEHLREMMGEATTTKEREAIKRCIREMEDD